MPHQQTAIRAAIGLTLALTYFIYIMPIFGNTNGAMYVTYLAIALA